MGKRFLFLAILVNALLIAVSATQSRASVSPQIESGVKCCIGGQCVQRPGYVCMFYPSCQGPGDCGVALTP